MSKILYLNGNIAADENSASNKLGNLFLEKYKKNNPNDTIEVIDLNKTKLSSIFLTKETMSTYYQSVDSDKWIDKLKNIDKLIISVPMINFGPTAVVKNFIDSVAVANKTFSYKYSKKGDAIGLLDNLSVMILASQGAPFDWYQWGSHVKWLEGTWKFFGAKKVESILLAGVKTPLFSGKSLDEIVDSVSSEVSEKAKKF